MTDLNQPQTDTTEVEMTATPGVDAVSVQEAGSAPAETVEREVTESQAVSSEGTAKSRESEQALGIMQVEDMIHRQLTDIDMMRDEMRMIKSSVDDAFSNDATYRDIETKSKEAAKQKNAIKKQMMNDPAIAEQVNKLDGMKAEMKDMQIALSDYLREYSRVSGMTHFETENGEMLEIVPVFKLIKKKS